MYDTGKWKFMSFFYVHIHGTVRPHWKLEHFPLASSWIEQEPRSSNVRTKYNSKRIHAVSEWTRWFSRDSRNNVRFIIWLALENKGETSNNTFE